MNFMVYEIIVFCEFLWFEYDIKVGLHTKKSDVKKHRSQLDFNQST